MIDVIVLLVAAVMILIAATGVSVAVARRRERQRELARCHHTRSIPVESGGESVARLCPDCGEQLPPTN